MILKYVDQYIYLKKPAFGMISVYLFRPIDVRDSRIMPGLFSEPLNHL